MSVDFDDIYGSRAAEFERLVSAEDADGRLLPALEAITDVAGRTVVEIGAGTGRVSRLLSGAGATVLATEASVEMLAELGRQTDPTDSIWPVRSDAASLPFRSAHADIGIAGWVLGHQVEWNPEDWRSSIGACLGELEEVVRPGGVVIVIETLGTGETEPNSPESLGDY